MTTPLRGAASLPFFTRLPASELLLFEWPKRSNQEKGHPAIAPCAQSLCYGCARPLRGSPTVRPWTDVELAHFLWATLRADPAQPRRDRGAPSSAHRARQSRSQSQSQSQSRHIRAVGHLPLLAGEGKKSRDSSDRGNPLCLGCAGCAVNGAPMQRQRGVGKARRVAHRKWASSTSVQGRTVGEPPESRCAVAGQATAWMQEVEQRREQLPNARRPLHRGGLLFAYFLLATQEKVGRSPGGE